MAGTWSGSKHSYEFAEGGRGILVTACRRSRLLDCRPSASVEIQTYLRPGVSQLEATWLAWAETEKRKRLGLSIYVSLLRLPDPSFFFDKAKRSTIVNTPHYSTTNPMSAKPKPPTVPFPATLRTGMHPRPNLGKWHWDQRTRHRLPSIFTL